MALGIKLGILASGARYLLDTYSATAAYSLRQLRSDVNFVVRVRRSGDNAESDFTATEVTDGTLASWVDAGGGTQSGFVTTWYDQVGSADLTQTTAAIQPEIYDNSAGLRTFGNGNCLSFPIVSNNYMNIGSAISELNDGPFSIFAAAQNNQSSQGAVICENLNNGGTGKLQLRLDTDGLSGIMLRYKNSSGTNYDIGASKNLTANTEYLISAFSDASKNISEFDNGSAGGTGTFTGNYTGNDFYIGKLGNSAVYLKGKIAELIVFGTDESANRTAIESDIGTYYQGEDLLLDTYPAAAAYSLRKLSKYTTSVVRVRRDLDNTERDFTADEITDGTLIGWVGVSTRRGYVVTWYDQSGNGNNITQSVASAQARIANNGSVQLLAGTSRPGASFGIANLQYYRRTALPELNHGNNFSIFSTHFNLTDADAIVSTRSTTALDRFVHLGGGSTNGPVGHVHNGSTAYFANTIQLSSQTTIATTIVDGTAKSINSWQNGGNNGNVTWTGTYTNAILQIGMDRDNDWEAGVLGEVIIFGTDQSANRTAIESNINNHYSIY